MRSFPKVQVGAFKAYVERQVATNHGFVDKRPHAKDFQEAFRIQAEHFQSRLKAAAEDAAKLGRELAEPFGRRSAEEICGGRDHAAAYEYRHRY